MASTTVSSDFFSRPRSCACLGSFQMSGDSRRSLTSSRRSRFRSYSKKPPQLAEAAAQVVDGGLDQVEAFGFHRRARRRYAG
jgi:hypothetical protein